jgi:modification methylase
MKKTKTSSFGSGKRESHDSSTFYSRQLYAGKFEEAAKEDMDVFIPPSEEWGNKIYCQSSENMGAVPDNGVALVFTSPPYNVGKDYDDDFNMEGYLEVIKKVGKEVYRVLRPGGRYVINIANLGRKPYIPLNALFYGVHLEIGFLPMGEIIWQKGKGANGSCAWGSWMSAKSPRLRDIHEYLLVFAKQSFSRPDKGKSDIERDEFLDGTLSIWEIPPESAKRVGHPAPFPIELASRVISLYSYVGDVILDPFVGSGTTCVAAVEKGRHYVGYDIDPNYCLLAEKRIKLTKPEPIQLSLDAINNGTEKAS